MNEWMNACMLHRPLLHSLTLLLSLSHIPNWPCQQILTFHNRAIKYLLSTAYVKDKHSWTLAKVVKTDFVRWLWQEEKELSSTLIYAGLGVLKFREGGRERGKRFKSEKWKITKRRLVWTWSTSWQLSKFKFYLAAETGSRGPVFPDGFQVPEKDTPEL